MYVFYLPYLLLRKLHEHAIDARRRDRTVRYLAWSAVAGIANGIMLALMLSLALVLVAVKLWWIGVPMFVALAAPILEPVVVRHVLVPLGWHRAAAVFARAALAKDIEAYVLCAAAWAHAHRPSPAAEAWVIARRDKRKPLGDGEVAVTALVAAARGDATTTRALLRSMLDLVEVHPHVREIAGEWLACDAAERGAWKELHEDATAARWPATPLRYLLEGVAARRIGASSAPSRRELWARWLLAPHRAATRALLADAAAKPTAVDVGDGAAALATAIDLDAPAMPRAIAAHLAVVEPGGATADSLARAVRAWDAALGDAGVQGWLARRALELDAPLGAVDRVLREVGKDAADELARVAELAGLGAPAGTGVVGGPLARRLRHGRLDALEAGLARWEERKKAGELRTPIDEWREFVALRAAYEAIAAAGGMELRRLAFPHAYSIGTTVSVWLWNVRSEYAMSHAISTWLLGEAMAVGDTQAIETCTQNTRLNVWTRLGKFVPPR